MRSTAPLGILPAVACAVLLHAVPAQAQPARVFVALTGADANPCTFASPCRSLQHAHDVVAAGGEMRMLDAGGYGPLTITKSISIVGSGHGRIEAGAGATAITINAGAADRIDLRGLTIEGLGTGGTGIVLNAGRALSIEGSVIRNFVANGIEFVPSTTSVLDVSRTVVADFSGHGSAILIAPSATAAVSATLSHVTVDDSYNGLYVLGTGTAGSVDVTVADSSIRNSDNDGIDARSDGGAVAIVVRDSIVANNTGTGLSAGPTTAIRVTRSRITSNGTGWSGPVSIYGANDIAGNTIANSAPPSATYE